MIGCHKTLSRYHLKTQLLTLMNDNGQELCRVWNRIAYIIDPWLSLSLLFDTRFGGGDAHVVVSATDPFIGAGAAGSSTAFHLQKFAALPGIRLNITVFERSSYVGGRSTTVNAYNSSLNPVELGASIFVEVNTILKNATQLFRLRPKESESEHEEILGIWNGQEFVYTQKGDSWWSLAKLFWKYGLAPYRTQKLMKDTVGKFRRLYEYPFFPFRSLSDRASDLGLIPITSLTGEQLLAANNVGKPCRRS